MKDLILQYEKDFFRAAFFKNKVDLENRFSKYFIEYGKSGAVYDRNSSINALVNVTEDRQIEIMQFELTTLSEDVLLARYISYSKDTKEYALRSSIWKIEDSSWKIFFHQGTPLNC